LNFDTPPGICGPVALTVRCDPLAVDFKGSRGMWLNNCHVICYKKQLLYISIKVEEKNSLFDWIPPGVSKFKT
jgi:hypothetical protein